MRTQKQIDASRRNGARSRGPATAEGKRVSAKNAIIHGVYSHEVVLDTENSADFAAYRDMWVAEYRPRTPEQLDLVNQIVSCRWRRRRAMFAGTAYFEAALAGLTSHNTVNSLLRTELGLYEEEQELRRRLQHLQSLPRLFPWGRRNKKMTNQTQEIPPSNKVKPSRDRKGAVSVAMPV